MAFDGCSFLFSWPFSLSARCIDPARSRAAQLTKGSGEADASLGFQTRAWAIKARIRRQRQLDKTNYPIEEGAINSGVSVKTLILTRIRKFAGADVRRLRLIRGEGFKNIPSLRKAVLKPPQSKRFATFYIFQISRSVWTAARSPPLFLAGDGVGKEKGRTYLRPGTLRPTKRTLSIRPDWGAFQALSFCAKFSG